MRSTREGFSFGRILSFALFASSLHIPVNTYSQNLVSRPVGFVRVAVPSNAPVLASQPFRMLDQSNALTSRVLKWDSESGYISSPATVETGDGFWLVNEPSTNQTIFLAGEVVLSPSNTALIHPGLNLVGYPYSGPVCLDETELWKLTNSVQILNAEAEEPSPADPAMGKGYWVKSLSEECIVWTEIRPYENVFPASGFPDIEAVTTKDGSSVALSIACEGDEALDVFYQDITPTNHFESARNWKLAETDLRANGQTAIEWTDSGESDREAPGKVVARYYLVGRADIDLNGNGIPDAREQFMGSAESKYLTPDYFSSETSTVAFSWIISTNTDLMKGDGTNGLPHPQPVFGRIIYVDRNCGSDLFSGRAALVVSGDGPKKTIRSGVNAATQPGDMVVIRQGQYGENLNIAGRDVHVVIEGSVNLSGVRMIEKPRPANSNLAITVGSTTNF